MATLKTVVRERLNTLFRDHQEVVINGVDDFPEYRYQIGFLRGVYESIEIVMHLLDRVEEEEEEGR